MVGDLNELMNNSEKMGGSLREETSFFPFRNMVRDYRLREIPSSGNKFSWAAERNKIWTQCFLDRAFGNSEWFQIFPRVTLNFLRELVLIIDLSSHDSRMRISNF